MVLTEQEREDARRFAIENGYTAPIEVLIVIPDTDADDDDIAAYDPECENETLCRYYSHSIVDACETCGCHQRPGGIIVCKALILYDVYHVRVCGTSTHCWTEYERVVGCITCSSYQLNTRLRTCAI